MTQIEIETKSGILKTEASLVSRTGGLLAVMPTVGRQEGKYSVTHIPTGRAMRMDMAGLVQAARYARCLYRELDKDEKKVLKSDVPEIVSQLSTSAGMLRFMNRKD